jgi:hypothetical protein
MGEGESRKVRIAEMLGNSKPKEKSRGILINGSNNIFVTGDLTIGRKITKGNARQKKKVEDIRQRGWRDEARMAIRMRAFELKLTEDQVIALASSLLKKFVPSLEALTAAELGRVFDSMHNLKRPALD